MNTHRFKIVAIIGIVLVIAVVFAVRDSGPSRDTIKIGAILPLTGNQAFIGEGIRNALDLALRNIGKTRHSYELIVEDNGFDVKTSITAARKLIEIDKVDVIIDAYAPIGNAVSPITQKEGITHISIAFDPKIAEGAYNFILFTTPETAARSFLAEMRKRDLKTLSIFRVNNQGIAAVHASIEAHAMEYGVRIVSDEVFQPGERDFKGLIARSMSAKPDLYALLALSPELEVLAKQLHDQKIQAISSTIYFELAKDKTPFEGLWSIGYGAVDPSFEDEYRKMYGRELGFGAANAFDAFGVVVRAAEQLHPAEVSSAALADNIQNMASYDGVLGTLYIDQAGIMDTPTLVKVVREGRLVVE